jgi:hypothetical protein
MVILSIFLDQKSSKSFILTMQQLDTKSFKYFPRKTHFNLTIFKSAAVKRLKHNIVDGLEIETLQKRKQIEIEKSIFEFIKIIFYVN